MTPIVDGLEVEYGDQIAFVRLNALDHGVGQRSFELLRLPGHPGFVLLTPDGAERWRSFGQQSADSFESALRDALADR